jgi:predicted protein tyrosine phosphatase
MNIQIFSAENAAKELKQHSKRWHVISLRDCKYGGSNHPLKDLEDNAKSMLVLKIDDVSDAKYEKWGYRVPRQTDVEEIIDWVKEENPKNLMVHCWAGVSRSSATAYVVACSMMEPEEAIKILDEKVHSPNELIISYGSKCLGISEIWRVYRLWKYGG